MVIVVYPPRLAFSTCVGKVHEPVCVQTLRSEFAVQALDEGIVRRFAGTGKVELDAFHVGPEIKVLRDELRPLVDPDGCLLYTSPSPRDQRGSRMPSSA